MTKLGSKFRWPHALAVVAVAALVAAAVSPSQSDELPAPRQSATDHLLSISDLMMSTIQPRHIRLWIAAQQNNWDFAGYELHNLRGAFNRLTGAHPVEDDIPLQDMVTSVMQQPFADLQAAIKKKDKAAFDKAYGDLTAGCNSCHQATNHDVVVIKVPQNAGVFDQDFTPAAP
jgi:hypothetical protein